MKKVIATLKSFGWGYLCFAPLFTAVGLCLLFFPSQSLDAMCYVVGGLTVAAGIFQGAVMLAKKQRGFSFFFSLFLALLAILSGGYILIFRSSALEYFATVIGLLIIVDASFKLQRAIEIRRADLWYWYMLVVLSVLGMGAGLYLLKWYNPSEVAFMAKMLGACLLVDALLNYIAPWCHLAINRAEAKKPLVKEETKEAKTPTATKSVEAKSETTAEVEIEIEVADKADKADKADNTEKDDDQDMAKKAE